jgi:lipid-A-disaccharide synthase-like uncharacterized protein
LDELFAKLAQKLLNPLVLFGLAGQVVFMLRFVLQWYVSERLGRSHVPLGFWYLSIAGGVMLMIYGVLDVDPVILLGQTLGLAIYVRNLVLIYRERARIAAAAAGAEKKMEGLAVAREEPSI